MTHIIFSSHIGSQNTLRQAIVTNDSSEFGEQSEPKGPLGGKRAFEFDSKAKWLLPGHGTASEEKTEMTKKPDTQLLKSVWSDSKNVISNKSIALERQDLDNLVASVFSNGPFYFYLVDFSNNMKMDYVHPSIEDIHGLPPDTVTFQDVLDQIHPDDMDFVARAEAICIDKMFRELPPDRRKKYKMSYCLRFRTADGSYRLFNHQAIILSYDEHGNLSKSLNVHTDISHLTDSNNHKASVIGMLGEPSFLNIDVYRDQHLPPPSEATFSRREGEIIRLMSDGLTSQAIASRMNISSNTVKNHRKNILQKSGCRNTGQLITKCITEGLL